jgi:hypothetical protein
LSFTLGARLTPFITRVPAIHLAGAFPRKFWNLYE